MKIFRLLPALMLVLPFFARPVAAVPLDLDAGLRAVVYDDNYKLGVGGELGVIAVTDTEWNYGLHLNYTHFTHKTQDWTDAQEMGGYVTAYYLPSMDQGFKVRVGPHIGGAYFAHNSFLDLGGDAMAVFSASKELSFYVAFVPSFFIGHNPQTLFRVGLGLEYRIGG